MADALFDEPRLAAIYDLVEGERRDLDHYLAIAAELGARSLLDVGCGTGTLACRAASQGMDVTGVVFAADGATLTSDSTRRFWSRAEIEDSLQAAGYALAEVRDAPDRPGYEWVFIARKP
jgi:cyclopropane fatty-acyl-phospholipid synthase-like methyltransferase